MTLWTPDEGALTQAVTHGKLKGAIRKSEGGYDFGPFVTVNASRENLVQFVTSEDAKLFRTKGVYTRVR